MPEHSTADRIVCSNLNQDSVTCHHFSGYRHSREISCGIFATLRVSGKTQEAGPDAGLLFLAGRAIGLRVVGDGRVEEAGRKDRVVFGMGEKALAAEFAVAQIGDGVRRLDSL